MKYRHIIALALLPLIASCGSGPDVVATEFSKALAKGDTTAALDMMDPGIKQLGGPKLAAAMSQAGRKAQEKGGIDDVKVLESNVDGDYAKVVVEDHFKNGSTSRDTIKLHKSDGKWLITM